jgi:hypothetical protein
MRLWSLHPKYLDRQGLTALWREGLLAQAVLRGRTRGYRSHPQLQRFRDSGRPLGLIAAYLHAVWQEAGRRGYHYDLRRIAGRAAPGRIPATRGQLQWEWVHLRRKLRARSPAVLARWASVAVPDAHPVFRPVPGGVADWERGAMPSRQPRSMKR